MSGNQANISGAKVFGWRQVILFTKIDDLIANLRKIIKIF